MCLHSVWFWRCIFSSYICWVVYAHFSLSCSRVSWKVACRLQLWAHILANPMSFQVLTFLISYNIQMKLKALIIPQNYSGWNYTPALPGLFRYKSMFSRQAMDSKTMFSFIFNFPNIWADCCKMLNINKLQIAPRWCAGQVGQLENFCNYHDERFG